jgi:NADH:ubiquinone oxidoreductase subunit
VDRPPSADDLGRREWEKPHHENLTGTGQAYKPPGSIASGLKPQKPERVYSAWQPE